MDDLSDEQLMLDYAAGKPGAFDVLYARHRGPLYRFVLRQAGEPALANDLYQGIWEKMIQARAAYRPAAPFRAWMYTIARNHLLDHWRRQQPIADVDLSEFEDEAAGPESTAIACEREEQLSAAIEQLPQVQKEALLLRLEGGLDLREIAQVSGVNEETAKSRLRYALAKLRPIFQPELPGKEAQHG